MRHWCAAADVPGSHRDAFVGTAWVFLTVRVRPSFEVPPRAKVTSEVVTSWPLSSLVTLVADRLGLLSVWLRCCSSLPRCHSFFLFFISPPRHPGRSPSVHGLSSGLKAASVRVKTHLARAAWYSSALLRRSHLALSGLGRRREDACYRACAFLSLYFSVLVCICTSPLIGIPNRNSFSRRLHSPTGMGASRHCR